MRPLLRAVLAADRLATAAALAAHALRDEIAASIVPEPERSEATLEAYRRASTYAPGGETFDGGVFAWESSALSARPFAPGSTLLLGGAGGGREIAGLGQMGFSVLAFEPCPALAVHAALVAEATPGARFARGSYDDLVELSRSGRGPLSPLLDGPRPEATVLGWASLSHLLDDDSIVQALRAAHVLTCGGPVLASFLLEPHEPPVIARLRSAARHALGRRGQPSLGYDPGAGFLRLFAEGDIDRLSSAAGYRVAHLHPEPYPHAVLISRGERSAAR